MADPMDLLEAYNRYKEQREAPLDLTRPQEADSIGIPNLPPKPYKPSAEDIAYIDQKEGTQNSNLYDDVTGQNLNPDNIANRDFQGNPTLPGGRMLSSDELASGIANIGGRSKDIYSPVDDAERKNIIADSIQNMANPIMEKNAPAELLTPEQRRAVLSRTYNLGNKAFNKAPGVKNDFGTLAQMAKDNPDMLNRLLPLMAKSNDEVKAGGVELPGLKARRADESKNMNTVSSLADFGKQDRDIISATDAAGRTLGQPMSPEEEYKLAEIQDRQNTSVPAGEIDLAKATQPPKVPATTQDMREFLIQEYNKLLKQEASPQLDQAGLDKAQTMDALNNIAASITRYGRNPNIKPAELSNYYGTELGKQKLVKDSSLDQMRNRTNLLSSLSNLRNKNLAGKTIRLGNRIYQQDEQGNLEVVAEDLNKETREETDAKRRQEYLQYQKEKGNRPSDKQTETITGISNSLNMLDRIKNLKGGVDTGPYASKLQKVKPYLPGADKDPKFVQLEQDSGLNLFDYIKSQSGTAFSDKEYNNLQKNMPNVNDDDETFNTKLANIESILKQKQAETLKGYEKQGKDVSKFKKASTTASAAFPKQVHKDGKVATVKNQAELDEAAQEGWQ